jgi:uncharacterized membrane protein (DUF373 family)
MLQRPISRIYRHAYLLVALLLMVFARPFFAAQNADIGLLDVLLMLTLLSAVFVSAQSRTSWFTIVTLAIVVVTSRVLEAGDAPPAWCAALFLMSMVLFNLGVALLLLQHIFQRQDRITTDAILGAISAYLLLGVAWACAFCLLDYYEPGSFDFGSRLAEEPRHQFWTFLGFSYTTLTTLGYGNISPTTPRADALANSQAIVGQFYVAVLIGRLVSMQLSQRPAAPDDAENP